MKNIESAVLELESLINSNLSKYQLPYEKGNSLRLGDIVIRKASSDGFVILDIKKNVSIGKTFTKIAAIAIAQAILNNKDFGSFFHYDKKIKKNYIDCQFYTNIINTTDNVDRKKAIMNRFDLSQEFIHDAREFLDKFIMDNIR